VLSSVATGATLASVEDAGVAATAEDDEGAVVLVAVVAFVTDFFVLVLDVACLVELVALVASSFLLAANTVVALESESDFPWTFVKSAVIGRLHNRNAKIIF
jgi:hypothetical protein